MQTNQFWEMRAQQFAAEGEGLRAVCSFAMPNFYNRAIDLTQRTALREVLRAIRPGDQILDYGCGVGRWTAAMARRGAHVTALDFSATMLAQAQARIHAMGLSECCQFVHCDVSRFETSDRFDLVIGVTVLQHVLDDACLADTIRRLAAKLKPGGRLVMVEAAPERSRRTCDTATFQSRSLNSYLTKLRDAGLRVVSIAGMDPMPFKLWVVPRFRTWPRAFALIALAASTMVSLPIDLLFARRLTHRSWHKIIVATTPPATP